MFGFSGDQGVQRGLDTISRIVGRTHRRLLLVVGRQEVDEAAQLQQSLDIVLEGQIGDTRLGGVGDGAAQFLGGHGLVGHGLDHVGTGHEHIGAVLHHEDEVGHGRRIDGATGAGAHDQRDLRHHARGHHIALEHFGIAGQRGDTFLNARTTGIIQTDDGSAHLQGVIHDLTDLLGVSFRQRAAEHGEVLTEHEHQTAIDGAVTGHHAVTRNGLRAHAEIVAAMLHEHIPFLERTFVEEQLDALTRGQLAFGMLSLNTLGTAAGPSTGTLLLQLSDDLLHGLPRVLGFFDR